MDAPPADGSEAFVTFGRGLLKVYNAAKNFGFISPVFKSEDSEGPPLPASCDEGLWFFGNHSLPNRAGPGLELTFEIWENAQSKVQARAVQVAAEPTAGQTEVQARELEVASRPRLHPNEPRVIYPSVYISDVPVEWNEGAIRKLHRQLGLNPDTIMGLKFLPFTEISLGLSGKGEKEALPVTGAVILRYLNEEAANAGVERLRGHPIQTSTGVTKHLGAKHATPPKWVVQRRQQEEDEKKTHTTRGESLSQKVTGVVARVAMSGYGVIKSMEWGEVMWRQYELPTNLRTLQFADKAKFQREVQGRDEYRRLKEMEGKEVEAELYKLQDGQLRASHVRIVQPGMLTDSRRPAMLEDRSGAAGSSAAPFGAGPGTVPMPPPPPHAQQRFEERMPPQQGGMPAGSPDGPPGMPMGPPGGMPPPPMLGHGGGPPGMQGMPGGPGGGPSGMLGMPPGMGGMPGPGGTMPPFFDPNYQAQMMQAMQAQMQMMQGRDKKKKDKKEKKEKKEKKKKDRKRSDSSEDDGRDRDDEEPKKRRIDDDDF